MSCRKFQYIITTTPEFDRAHGDAQFVDLHRVDCSTCAEFERRMFAIEQQLRAIPQAPTDDSFASAVMARVRTRAPQPVSLRERLLGPAYGHRPSRAYAFAGAAALCALLAVGGMTMRGTMGRVTPAPNSVNIAQVTGPDAADVDYGEVGDLVRGNQAVAMDQPLSDDPSLRLVSHSPSDE
jgi:hypothetical protein